MTVQKVPMPDGILRPETGAMQFDDDWPGVFIRGDNAFAAVMSLEHLLAVVPDTGAIVEMHKGEARRLISTLRSCDAGALTET